MTSSSHTLFGSIFCAKTSNPTPRCEILVLKNHIHELGWHIDTFCLCVCRRNVFFIHTKTGVFRQVSHSGSSCPARGWQHTYWESVPLHHVIFHLRYVLNYMFCCETCACMAGCGGIHTRMRSCNAMHAYVLCMCACVYVGVFCAYYIFVHIRV
jgi:hypothetical protein